jgi:uncharacterized protein YprB with RNaseH-like and TPR domain
MAVCYLDIETSSQKANTGMVITIGLSMNGEMDVRFAANADEEKKLLEWFKGKLDDCELIVTWYGSGFDIPFLLTRAIAQNVDLTRLAEVPMLDLCEWSRANLLLSSYSLDSVAWFLGMDWSKDFHGADILALFKLVERGDHEARRLIVEHCREDVEVLKQVHERLKPLVKSSGWGYPRKPSKEE